MHTKGNDNPLAIALFLFLLCIYLLTFSGSLHSSDGQAMFSVSESLVRRGAYDINQIRWMGLQQGAFGSDGNLYCHKGLGTPLVALPLAWLGLVVPAWGVVQTTMLLNVVVTALTGTVVFAYVRRLGYTPATACASALVFGLATIAWPYAKYFFSEPLTGICLLAAAYFTLQLGLPQGESPSWLRLALAGFCLGLAIATRFANAALVPIYAVLLAVHLLRTAGIARWSTMRCQPSLLVTATWRGLLAFAVPLAIWAAVLAGYNYVRFGNLLTTGYVGEQSFSAPWVTGILGLLVSPGKGLLVFCPVLVAVLPSLPSFFRRHRLHATLTVLVAVAYVLLYGKWFMWHGGFAWGPRFLVPIIPLLCVALAPLLERLEGRRRAAFWALFAVSAAIQVVGLSVHFVHYQEALLQTGLPLFDPVTFFHPRYSQILGTLRFLRPENLDFAWVRTVPSFAIDWVALATSLLLLGLCAWVFSLVVRPSAAPRPWRIHVFVLLPLLIAGGAALCLARYKNDGHGDYVQMLGYLQASSRPSDAIVQNSPPETAIMQNHYKGRLPSYGLFEGEQPLPEDTLALLDTLAERHPRIWLIPGDLPPQTSSLDLWFAQQGWAAEHRSFGSERLTLYVRP
ncbi:MAG TPA: hypothetical protein VM075_04180 [Anaerolineae bacterium]|nr:hypothetical protein [Anaerolineae bacterium]